MSTPFSPGCMQRTQDIGRNMQFSACAGDIGEVLYGASLLPKLKRLDLSGQAFTGTLPNSSLSMPILEELDLSNNYIEVGIRLLCRRQAFNAMDNEIRPQHVVVGLRISLCRGLCRRIGGWMLRFLGCRTSLCLSTQTLGEHCQRPGARMAAVSGHCPGWRSTTAMFRGPFRPHGRLTCQR